MGAKRSRNPFKPTAGMNPPELIGRNAILEEFEEGLDNGPGAPDRLMRISGVRGVGKTVLLNAIGKIASERGLTIVDAASNAGFCERIREALLKETKIKSAELSPSVLGVSLGSIELGSNEPTLGEAMLKASESHGLLVTLDEIQDAPVEEMRTLGNEIQLLIRKEADVAFVFAGLPSAVDDVVSEKTLTFLQRAKLVKLLPLSNNEVGESIGETMRSSGMEISEELEDKLAQAAAGYPFMIQLVGYYTWQAAARRGAASIADEDVRRGIAKARSNFDVMVIEPAIRRLPRMQVMYLSAMAECGDGAIESGAVAQAMGRSTKEVSSYRARLIDQGLIMKSGYGLVEFAIPYMADYLRATAEDRE